MTQDSVSAVRLTEAQEDEIARGLVARARSEGTEPVGPEGLFVAAGFSGAGFKKGPAVGEAMAGLLLDGGVDWVDLAPFRPDRFIDEGWRAPWSDTEYDLGSDFGHGF